MITLDIRNISRSYNKTVQKHNHNVRIKKYLSSLGFYSGRNTGNYEEEYKFCYRIKFQYNSGMIDTILFAYKHDKKYNYASYEYTPDVIIGGSIIDREPEKAIYKFCAKYGEYLLDGYDIESIALNDEENILNYKKEKQFTKKIKTN